MFGEFSNTQWHGLAFVFLGLALMVGMLVRKYVPILRRLYIPGSVITGFLILILGPQVVGQFTSGWSLFPTRALEIIELLPGLLINIVFAGIMLGKSLPSFKQVWREAAPHVILGSIFSFGQFALGAFAVFLILTPFFGLNPVAGSILELSFAGGHGTIAGMGTLLEEAGAPEIVDVGLGLATISMLTGIIGGSLLVNYAIRNPRISVARTAGDDTPLSESLSHVMPNSGDQIDQKVGLASVSRSFGAIAVAIGLAVVMLELIRGALHLVGSDVMDSFPLFPFTVIGGFIVQLVLTKVGQEAILDRRTINDICGLSLDLLIAAAIGTMSLAALSANWVSLLILTIIAFAWSVFGLLWLGPKIHNKNWFEHGIADYGQSQGNVAAGFILADMADPARQTSAARAYGYKQLIYEPMLGGGILTALSIPLLLSIGTMWFGIISLILTGLLILWGTSRAKRTATAA